MRPANPGPRLYAGARKTALLAMVLVLLLPALAPAAVDDEFVPEGTLFTGFTLRTVTQDRAISRLSKSQTFKDYAIPEASIRGQISGDIEREITRYDFRFTLGLSDTWNISLNLPLLDMKQNSTLATSGSAEAVATVARLQSDSISGIGEIEFTSLHRPVFSDSNAFIWAYGLTLPGAGQQSPYHDSSTFDLSTPVPWMFFFIHYTRYPALPRARFDVRFKVRRGIQRSVDTTTGQKQRLIPGNQILLKFNWTQDIGIFSYGFELERIDLRDNRLGGENLFDGEKAQTLRLLLGLGNLADLEEGPVGFPYQVRLEVEKVNRGFNHPFGDTLTLSLLMFF